MSEKKKILLHVCCAPCASGCLWRLFEEEYTPVLFFSNSNIDTREEFDRRLDSVRRLADEFHLELIVDEYRHDRWLAHVAGLEDEPERGMRCSKCFHFSFQRAADKAAELKMHFTTTLSVSPYKSSERLRTEGMLFDAFEFYNFKKRDGYAISIAESRRLGLYCQRYCGCEFARKKQGGEPRADS